MAVSVWLWVGGCGCVAPNELKISPHLFPKRHVCLKNVSHTLKNVYRNVFCLFVKNEILQIIRKLHRKFVSVKLERSAAYLPNCHSQRGYCD